jgi:dihydroxy-acid dehydratase
VTDDELARRREGWQPPAARFGRGYGTMFLHETTQAHEGCDFQFLHAGTSTPEPDIY